MFKLPSIVLIAISLFVGSFSEKGVTFLKKKKSVRPIYHRGYYKNHIYKRHPKFGLIRIARFEKQGVKKIPVPK